MKKRIVTLLLAALMVVPMLLTSCSGGTEETQQGTAAQVEAKRGIVWLRMYAITDERTSEEAIARVEDEVNRLTYLRYKTYLDLKFCTADEYQKAQDDAQAQFDANAAESSRIEESLEASRKAEKKAEKSLSPEELRKKRQQDRLAAKESVRASKAEEQARLDRIARGEEEPPSPISELQMDLVFIESFDKLVEMIDNERLISLDKYLEENYTIFSDYIQPAVMAGVANAGNGVTYAIPTNSSVTPEGSFMLFNKKVVEELGIDLSNVKRLSDLTSILATVKAQRPDLLPVEKAITIIQEFDYFGANGAPIGAPNREDIWLQNSSNGVAITDKAVLGKHFELMYNWRMDGYFTTGPAYVFPEDYEHTYEDITAPQPGDAEADFFMTVREGSIYDKEKWEEEGYTVITYNSPEYTTENSLKTFYGISANSRQPDRAMEILKMMTTDSQLKNALQYGVEGVDYSVNEDQKTVTILSKDYFMDFYGTGNTFIGYVPETIEGYFADGVEYYDKAMELSHRAKINAFLGYHPRFTPEQKAMYEEMTEVGKAGFEQLCTGTPDHLSLPRKTRELMDEVVKKYFPELTTDTFILEFNSSYAPCLVLLREKSLEVRPPENKNPDFISVSQSIVDASKSAAAATAVTTTVAPSSAAATASAVASASAPAATGSAVPASSVPASSKVQ